jgi:hypothetical protein
LKSKEKSKPNEFALARMHEHNSTRNTNTPYHEAHLAAAIGEKATPEQQRIFDWVESRKKN